ncbi:MAG: hypothetical protein PWR01_4439 [Clostridiales bacterium]|nr:hypothetical protein [Clostridiales bacterium]MDN5283366.1 hypothetical protein [Candidatus Ozemobacter sp.]
MKKIIIGILAVLLFASAPLSAGNLSAMKVDPNDQAVVALLWLVHSDLQMCRTSMNQSIMDNVSAIGHLNNSQSALRKANLDPAYDLLIGEIDKRISKIKFYLVMNERRAVEQRIQQLMVIIRNVLGASSGNLPNTGGYNGGYNTNGFNNGFGNPNGSGFVPPIKPEIPVGGQSVQGMPVMPSGVVPVR